MKVGDKTIRQAHGFILSLSKDKRGFLLFEVIVSIVIITAGLLYVMRAYSSSKEAVERSRVLFESSLLLEREIFGFEEKGEIEEGSSQGTFTDFQNYSWAINATPLSRGDSNLNAVTLDVSKKEGSSITRYSLATYLKNKVR